MTFVLPLNRQNVEWALHKVSKQGSQRLLTHRELLWCCRNPWTRINTFHSVVFPSDPSGYSRTTQNFFLGKTIFQKDIRQRLVPPDAKVHQFCKLFNKISTYILATKTAKTFFTVTRRYWLKPPWNWDKDSMTKALPWNLLRRSFVTEQNWQ